MKNYFDKITKHLLEDEDVNIKDDTKYLPEDIQAVIISLSNYLRNTIDEVLVSGSKARIYVSKDGNVEEITKDDLKKLSNAEKFSHISFDTKRNKMYLQFDL